MIGYILVAVLALPFIDFYLLFRLTSVIGFWRTLAIVLGTGLAGAWFVRREGRFVLRKFSTSVTAGEISRNFLEALLLFIAGITLITPGIITDLLGFLLAFRPVRERLVVRLAGKFDGSANVEFEVLEL